MGYRFNAAKVKGILAENDMTQKQFSAILGTSENTARYKLNGKHEFTASEICMIASYFNQEPAIFFEKEVA